MPAAKLSSLRFSAIALCLVEIACSSDSFVSLLFLPLLLLPGPEEGSAEPILLLWLLEEVVLLLVSLAPEEALWIT